MASGVKVDDECVCAIADLKTKGGHTALIMKLSEDNKKIVVEKKVELDKSIQDIKNELKPENPCYILYDSFHKQKADSMAKKRLQLIVWCHDNAKIKQKMLMASSKDALKKKIEGASEKDWQWCDDESADENVQEQLSIKCDFESQQCQK